MISPRGMPQEIDDISDVVGSGPLLQDGLKSFEEAIPKSKETDRADLTNGSTSQPPLVTTGSDDLVQIPMGEEQQALRKVAGSVPWIAYALCVVELAERASYYGASQVFTNFLQKPLPEHGNGAGAPPEGTEVTPGALGQGLQVANAVLLLFKFFAYTLPVFGAWLADTKIGRHKAIVVGVIICGVAHVVQVVGALPEVLQQGEGLAPFLISIFLLAIGAGIFKPNILPIVLDQYRNQQPYVSKLKSGEQVIVDPEATINRITLVFYSFVNIGGFFPMASVFAEKKVGFWLAFLLPGIIYFLLPIGLLATYKKTHRVAPNGSAVNDFFEVIIVALSRSKGRFWKHGFWNASKPSVLASAGVMSWKGQAINWTDATVVDVRRTLSACKIFLYFPIYYLNAGGIGAIATSQGGTMTTDGVPNDLMSNFNPLTIIVFAPFLTHVAYPMLRSLNMMPKPVTRITFGFTLACASSVCGAATQWYIYTTSPCGYYATECDRGSTVSPMHIWWQLPIYVLAGMSECFCQVTAYEIAYSRSAESMRGLVMACFLFMNAISNALAQAVTPAMKDPNLIYVWAGPAVAMFFVSVVFYFRHRYMDD